MLVKPVVILQRKNMEKPTNNNKAYTDASMNEEKILNNRYSELKCNKENSIEKDLTIQ